MVLHHLQHIKPLEKREWYATKHNVRLWVLGMGLFCFLSVPYYAKKGGLDFVPPPPPPTSWPLDKFVL